MSVVSGAAFAYLTNAASPVTGNYSVTAGRALVAVAFGFSITSFDTMTVNGVAMTPIAAVFTSGSYSARMYIIESLASSGSMPISFGFTGGGNAVVALWEIYDNVTGACTNDGYNTGSGTGADPSISVTTGATDSFMIGFVNPSSSATAGAGYTLDSIAWWNYEQAEHKANAGAPGSIPVNWTILAGTWMGLAAGFKAASSGAPSTAQIWPAMVGATNNAVMIGRRFI